MSSVSMKANKVDVSVIIVNYNTISLTSSCIESIFNKTEGITFEIILVDNASTDGSLDFFSNDSRIRYIYNTINLGFGKANNIGYRYATGKYVFLLNSDTLLINNAIKFFFDFMETNDKIACCGCVLSDSEGRPIHSFGKFITLKSVIRQFFGYYTRFTKKKISKEQEYNYTFPLSVEYITGADLFIRKKYIDKYGLFNESFFMYFEDAYLQYKYKTHGLQSMIINSARIIHLEGGSRRHRPFRSWLMGFSSELNFLRLTLTPLHLLILKLITPLFIFPIILFYPTQFSNKRYGIKLLFSSLYSKDD